MHEYRSEELGELFAALSKAQSEIRVAVKDANNPFFKSKYANLQAVVESSRAALCKNNLAVTQVMRFDEKGDYLLTILCHGTGQWISSCMRIAPAKSDIQSLGSYITYARRYSYASLVGVYDGEEDDDGNNAVTPQPILHQKPVMTSLISEDQVDILEMELREYPTVKKSLLSMLAISDIKFMERNMFNDMLKKVREIIAGHISAKK